MNRFNVVTMALSDVYEAVTVARHKVISLATSAVHRVSGDAPPGLTYLKLSAVLDAS